MSKYDVDFSANEVTVQAGEINVKVKCTIPYSQKEQYALDLASSTLVTDGEIGIGFISYQYEAVNAFLFAKYYTDIDVAEFDTEDGHAKLFDFLLYHNIQERAYEINQRIFDDINTVQSIYKGIVKAAQDVYREKNSLAYKIKTSFSSILSDKDLIETLAKSQAVSEKMVDLMGEAAKANGRIPPIKVGGGVVKFSKKIDS